METEENYRLFPPANHRDYLILSDLLAWLRMVAPDSDGPVLDYGCDASPYRSLFGKLVYERADLPGTPGIEYEIAEDESIEATEGRFGTVLSTQVLEHVDHYMEYLREAHRVLRPGGRLILSTHGMFEEHGHPHDFRRWTLVALAADIERAGFVIEKSAKLTVGGRALAYKLGSHIWKMNPSRKHLLGFAVSWLRNFILHHPDRWNKFADRHFGDQSMIAGPGADESLYVGIAFVARRL